MRSTMLACTFVAALSLGVASAQSAMGGSIDAKALSQYQKAYATAKKSYKRHPSPRSKETLIAATDRYALASMYATNLQPKVKYPQALRLYREVLKIDPNNREAKNNAGMIVDIYHQMHRPIPPN